MMDSADSVPLSDPAEPWVRMELLTPIVTLVTVLLPVAAVVSRSVSFSLSGISPWLASAASLPDLLASGAVVLAPVAASAGIAWLVAVTLVPHHLRLRAVTTRFHHLPEIDRIRYTLNGLIKRRTQRAERVKSVSAQIARLKDAATADPGSDVEARRTEIARLQRILAQEGAEEGEDRAAWEALGDEMSAAGEGIATVRAEYDQIEREAPVVARLFQSRKVQLPMTILTLMIGIPIGVAGIPLQLWPSLALGIPAYLWILRVAYRHGRVRFRDIAPVIIITTILAALTAGLYTRPNAIVDVRFSADAAPDDGLHMLIAESANLYYLVPCDRFPDPTGVPIDYVEAFNPLPRRPFELFDQQSLWAVIAGNESLHFGLQPCPPS